MRCDASDIIIYIFFNLARALNRKSVLVFTIPSIIGRLLFTPRFFVDGTFTKRREEHSAPISIGIPSAVRRNCYHSRLEIGQRAT